MSSPMWIPLAGAVLAGCVSSGASHPAPNEIEAAWRVRCPRSGEPCNYPEREMSGPIGHDDPDYMFVYCDIRDDHVEARFGRAHLDGQPGFQVSVSLGYDAASGFDLARRCQVWMIEEDGRMWSASCSDFGACRVEAPSLVSDGALSLAVRCEDMPSIPFQVGREALFAAAADPAAPVEIQISRCTQH